MSQWKQQLEKTYALSEEEAAAVQDNPQEALPGLLARVHMAAAEQTVQYMTSQLPNAVTALIEQKRQEWSNENAFYKRWPRLRDPAHAATVQTMAQAYRAMNPSASREEFITNVGAQAMIALRLPLEEQAPQAQPGQPPRGAPTPGQVQQRFTQTNQPYQPAPPSPAGVAAAPQPDDDFDPDLLEVYEHSKAHGW